MTDERAATVRSKGRVTIPAAIRERLGVMDGGAVVFAVMEDRRVELRANRYPTVASLSGAAGSLKQPLSWEEMRAIIRAEQADHVILDRTIPSK